MRTFWQLLNETQGMGVPFLYPLGYQGVGQYPPQYLTALFPDALIYIAADERLQHCWEEEPFKIDQLGPQPIFNIKYGKESLVSTHPKLPPGHSVPWKPLPPDPDEKHFPKGPAHPCMISKPECLPGNVAGLDAEKFGDPCHGKWNIPEGAIIRREYAPLVGAMPGQVPTPSSMYPYGVKSSQPIIPDEFPPPNIVFDKKQKKKKPKLNEGGKMKSFLQFLELMEAKKNESLPKPMAKADQEYRAFDEKKDKKGKNLKME